MNTQNFQGNTVDYLELTDEELAGLDLTDPAASANLPGKGRIRRANAAAAIRKLLSQGRQANTFGRAISYFSKDRSRRDADR